MVKGKFCSGSRLAARQSLALKWEGVAKTGILADNWPGARVGETFGTACCVSPVLGDEMMLSWCGTSAGWCATANVTQASDGVASSLGSGLDQREEKRTRNAEEKKQQFRAPLDSSNEGNDSGERAAKSAATARGERAPQVAVHMWLEKSGHGAWELKRGGKVGEWERPWPYGVTYGEFVAVHSPPSLGRRLRRLQEISPLPTTRKRAINTDCVACPSARQQLRAAVPLLLLPSCQLHAVAMSSHNDPRLLYSIPGIKAYHIQNGEEDSLTPSGPQTLSLLMVPTSSPFADPSARNTNDAPEEDFYLHLNLPPELDLPLPATTQIYHQPPSSYLIPRWDLGPDSGAFTRIEFPSLGQGVTQEDVDTFETILAQCTAFLERAQAPSTEKGGYAAYNPAQYNPADYKPGQGYVEGTGKGQHGQIVLVDEDNGSVVGELADGAMIDEDPRLRPGSKSEILTGKYSSPFADHRKDPVEVEISADGKHVDVRPISEEYLRMARHPAYKDSSLVQNAAAASRLIVTGSTYLSDIMTSGATQFTQKTKPNQKPVTFKPTTHDRVRKIHDFTYSAASISAKTVGQATKYAQNFGASLSGRGKGKEKGEGYKPGFLNKSMIAFSTVADGLEYGGKKLLSSSGVAASQVVGHKYGQDAGNLTAELAGGVKNVGLVYIDVTGVSRRAVLKSVAKGMVVGKVKGGGEVVVGGGDGGVVPEEDMKKAHGAIQSGAVNDNLGQGQPGGGSAAPGGVVGFGNAVPQSGSSGIGEPLAGQALQGQYINEKR